MGQLSGDSNSRTSHEGRLCCARAPQATQEGAALDTVPLAAVLPSLGHRPALLDPPRTATRVASKQARDRQGQSTIQDKQPSKKRYGKVGVPSRPELRISTATHRGGGKRNNRDKEETQAQVTEGVPRKVKEGPDNFSHSETSKRDGGTRASNNKSPACPPLLSAAFLCVWFFLRFSFWPCCPY